MIMRHGLSTGFMIFIQGRWTATLSLKNKAPKVRASSARFVRREPKRTGPEIGRFPKHQRCVIFLDELTVSV